MKTNKIRYMVGIALVSAFVSANAQDLPQASAPAPQPLMPQAVVAPQAPVVQAQPSAEKITDYSRGGNSFEREVTPLLREISRKKSILEIRKLDREIEKLDEESLKASSGGDNAGNGGFVPLPVPQNIPSAMPTTVAPTQVANNSPDLSVVMIYGYEKDLYAKISYGTKGGYPVKAGDTLPNGEYVYAITPNYIEIGDAPNAKTKKKSKTMKVYATGYPRQGQSGNGVQSSGLQMQSNGTFPLPTGIPTAPLVTNSGLISNSPTIGLPVLAPTPGN